MCYLYPLLLLLTISFKADSCHTTIPVTADTISAPAHEEVTLPEKVVAFAKTLLGTPYKFGCTAPDMGFDCSGFINYVFNHFSITVPRSSEGFTNEGTAILLANALPGDLILFTGTNSNVRTVGHVGLIVANDTAGISFIHSSSGKENAVIITHLDDRYRRRFVKVIRIM
jgi:cell wall-associated NlpC family hydrolase